MSDLNLSSFYPVDEFALIYGQAMDPDSAPSHFLGDVSISFDSTFSLGLEPIGDYPMDFQESAGLVPHDTKEETLQPIGILAPLVADYVLANPNKPFDGEVSTQDTYLKDVKRYMDKHGKAPHCSAFVREDFSFQRRRVRSKPTRVYSNIPTTPVRKRVAPLPKRAKQAISRSLVTVSDTPNKRTPTQKKHSAFRAFVMVNSPKETPVLEALTEEPITKKVKKELINSTSAADDLPSFAPILTSVDVSVVPPSPVSITPSLPTETISESPQELPSTPESTKPMTRKRKLDSEVKEEGCQSEDPVPQAKRATPVGEKWENRDDSCSIRHVKGVARYRCDLCHKADRKMITKTYGDMKRHLQSLAHQKRDFECTTPGCGKAYTRIDALKRHQDKCKGGA